MSAPKWTASVQLYTGAMHARMRPDSWMAPQSQGCGLALQMQQAHLQRKVWPSLLGLVALLKLSREWELQVKYSLGAGLSMAVPFPGSEQLTSAVTFPAAISYSKSCSPTLHTTSTATPCSVQMTSLLGFWDKGDLSTQAFQPIAKVPHVTAVRVKFRDTVHQPFQFSCSSPQSCSSRREMMFPNRLLEAHCEDQS